MKRIETCAYHTTRKSLVGVRRLGIVEARS